MPNATGCHAAQRRKGAGCGWTTALWFTIRMASRTME
jgi:hypothetical protein